MRKRMRRDANSGERAAYRMCAKVGGRVGYRRELTKAKLRPGRGVDKACFRRVAVCPVSHEDIDFLGIPVFACMLQHASTGPILANLAKSAEMLWSRACRVLPLLADVDDFHSALGHASYLLVRRR